MRLELPPTFLNVRVARARTRKKLATFLVLLLPWSTPCNAHVLQYLTWFKIARKIEVSPGNVRIVHDCRFDPATFRSTDPMMDTDGDSTASASEIAAFCLQAGNYLALDFAVISGGTPCSSRQTSFLVFNDNSGFRSEIVAIVPMPSGTTQSLEILDPSYIFPTPPSPEAAKSAAIASTVSPEISLLDEKNIPQTQIPTGHDVRTSLRVVLKENRPCPHCA